MPVSKNAYRRFQLIDEMLQKGRYASRQQIMNYLEDQGYLVSISTFEKDLETMRSKFSLPIAYDRSREGYYYTDPNACFDVPLSSQDVETIKLALGKLEQFRYSQSFKNVSNSIERISNRLKIDLSSKPKDNEKILFYEPEPFVAGSEWLSVIFDAIKETRSISFVFVEFRNKTSHLIDPYMLKEFAGRWYVVGIENGKTIYYGLDRIKELVVTEKRYLFNEEVAVVLQKDIVQNTGLLDFVIHSHDIMILYDASVSIEIRQNPLLKKMRILSEDDKEILVLCRVRITEDFIQRAIFTYGAKATVISPPFAVDLVLFSLTKMLTLHKPDSPRMVYQLFDTKFL
jgi:predicted DNA-binding transcriptional regulator YafY